MNEYMNETGKHGFSKKYLAEQTRQLSIGIFGALLYAVGMNLFIVPVHLYSGGLMGFSQLIRTLLVNYAHMAFGSVDIAGIIYYMLNIPLLYIAFRKIGRRFFVKTMICTTAMTIFLSLISIPATPIMGDDVLASCLIGGIICGIGLGIPLQMGCSTGGTDIIGLMLIRERRNVSVGKISLTMNLVLYGLCLFLFDISTVIYSVIYAAVNSIAVDKLHSQNIIVEVKVVTKEKNEEMEKEILAHLERGVTVWQAKGAYTDEPKHMLYILLSKYELPYLKFIIHKHDPHAFIVVNEGVNIGGNFQKKL